MLFSGPRAFGVLGMCFPGCPCSRRLLRWHDARSCLGRMVSQGELLPSEDGLNGQPSATLQVPQALVMAWEKGFWGQQRTVGSSCDSAE